MVQSFPCSKNFKFNLHYIYTGMCADRCMNTASIMERKALFEDKSTAQDIFDMLYQIGGTACVDCFFYFVKRTKGLTDTDVEKEMDFLYEKGIIDIRIPNEYCTTHIAVYSINDKGMDYASPWLVKGNLGQTFRDFQETETWHSCKPGCIDHTPYRLFQPVFV